MNRKRKEELIYQKANGDLLPVNQQSRAFFIYFFKKPHVSTRYRNVSIGKNGIAIFKVNENIVNTNKRLPELYKEKEECCGCTACLNICSNFAISMEFDEEGFKYPVVDAEKCIRCYKCLSICPCQ